LSSIGDARAAAAREESSTNPKTSGHNLIARGVLKMTSSRRILLPVVLSWLLSACSSGGGPAQSTSMGLQSVVAGLDSPVFMATPPADASRLFIVEQTGAIRIFDPATSTLRAAPFIDLSGVISRGGERGLLGLAFDPAYSANRRFYVFYTNVAGDLVVAAYLRSAADANLADPGGTVLLTIAHPAFANHNGGMLAFGPDGCLYVGTGDGGSGGDPGNNGQNTSSRLGKILRIDPASGAACTNGGDNPFAAGGGAAEVWSFGLRNPWRFSFDRQTGDLYIADVGQDTREEVDVSTGANPGRGSNFGWRLMEGFICFDPPANCNPGGLALPVIDYPHTGGACSITGGYVYRGSAAPLMRGTYFYSDFCAGFVKSFRHVNAAATDMTVWPSLAPPGGQVTSFGEDANGELYLVTQGGNLWKIVPN
jgi:glucose/arabinose dehydrogenase